MMKKTIVFILILFAALNEHVAQICVNHQNNIGINDDFPSAKLSIKSLTNRYMIKNQFTNEIPDLSYIKGLENRLDINSETIPFGISNSFKINSDGNVNAYGFYNNITVAGNGVGKIHGMKNNITGTGEWTWVGVATYLDDTNTGNVYGTHNVIDKYNNSSSCYGYRSDVNIFPGSAFQ